MTSIAANIDPVSAARTVIDGYGPYAFGVIAFAVIIGVLAAGTVYIWRSVIRPMLDLSTEIAAKNAESTGNLRETSQSLERTGAELGRTADVLQRTAEVYAKQTEYLRLVSREYKG